MSIPELTTQLNNQVSLLKSLVESHSADLKYYPIGEYSLASLDRLEHCYNSLLTLNEMLAKPIKTDPESASCLAIDLC